VELGTRHIKYTYKFSANLLVHNIINLATVIGVYNILGKIVQKWAYKQHYYEFAVQFGLFVCVEVFKDKIS
jgi:hypothetical protein